MSQYEVYLYNIPKVSEDGKQAIPVPKNETMQFASLDEAKKFAAERKDRFDRAVVMQKDDEGQKLVERYVDGQHETPENIVRR